MTTTVIKTIKPAGGGDYTTLNDFEANYPTKNIVGADTVVVAEVYSGGNCIDPTGASITFGAWTTDATRYIIIRAAVGHEHQGIWNTAKAYGRLTSNGPHVIYTPAKIQVKSMQFWSDVGLALYLAGPFDYSVDMCWLKRNAGGTALGVAKENGGSPTLIVKSSIIIGLTGWPIASYFGCTANVYNCTLIGGTSGLATWTPADIINSQNNYISAPLCYDTTEGTGGTINKGSNDATSTTEAVTPALRSIPYTTANFVNVTGGSEDLHLVVGSVLRDAGTNTPAVLDIDGRMRIAPFDIGADEYLDAPVCWNYTARYRNSTKLFKASGCGNYPKSLRAPSNIDKTTGRMIDDGVEIDPSEYEII